MDSLTGDENSPLETTALSAATPLPAAHTLTHHIQTMNLIAVHWSAGFHNHATLFTLLPCSYLRASLGVGPGRFTMHQVALGPITRWAKLRLSLQYTLPRSLTEEKVI